VIKAQCNAQCVDCWLRWYGRQLNGAMERSIELSIYMLIGYPRDNLNEMSNWHRYTMRGQRRRVRKTNEIARVLRGSLVVFPRGDIVFCC